MITFLVGIFCSMPAHSSEKERERLSKLQQLINDNIIYDQEVDDDSIILWGQELESFFEKEKRYETLFKMKQMVVRAFALRGDINTAVDYARHMYAQAKKMNYDIGIALSTRAVGDAYLNSILKNEAIESYKESLLLFNQIKNAHAFKIRLLPALIATLLKSGRTEEAWTYLQQLDELNKQHPSLPGEFFLKACYTHYYIHTQDTIKAESYLYQTEEIEKGYPRLYYKFILHYLRANYYKETKQYQKALEEYAKLTTKSEKGLTNQQIEFSQAQALLLAQMEQANESCLLFQRANRMKDSINNLSYSRQINHLRTTYQVDQMEIQTQQLKNIIISWSIGALVVLLLLVTILIQHIKKENKRLLTSKIKLEKAQQDAKDSTLTKSLFLSNMSHEIRTPLNALSGFSSILTDESIDNETRIQCNEIIQQNSELLLNLINDVIDLSSLDAGKLTFNYNECDAVALCRNVVGTVEKIKQTAAELVFTTTLPSLPLLTDSSRIQQVLINLLINATKFTPQGTITLELSRLSDTEALFCVTDTGCGIPLEKQNQIFNRFEKLNEGAQGTGLGLSICQLIIEQIGGKIAIDPAYTGGSRFVFTHPIRPVNRKETLK
ncbi:MAG: HAMP domain-containing sensor histidine kinase [Bacteroides sp.]